MARMGKKNPSWKGGISSDYRRRITNAKKGDEVHHKDKNKKNNAKSNLQKLSPLNGISAKGRHNKLHPEKGRK